MHSAIQRFSASLGKRPYCSNNGTASLIRSQPQALLYDYVSLNRKRVTYLAFDLDFKGAAYAHEREGLPPPTLTMVNPDNAHAHLMYELKHPVIVTDAARPGPVKYLSDVEARMCYQLCGDANFAGLMIKNPLSNRWRTIANDCRYDLGQLLEYLPDKKLRKKIQPSGWGRNCTLFDALRKWAYPRIAAARSAGFDAWHAVCVRRCEALNTFNPPLPASEVRSTAKSIASWTWRKYTGSAKASHIEAAAQRIADAHGLRAEDVLKLLPGLVAKEAGCHRDTVHELCKAGQSQT